MFKAISEAVALYENSCLFQETLSKFSKVKSEMEQECNYQVQTKDVAKKMNIEPDKIETFLSAYTKTISIESGLERDNGKDLNIADILEDERASVSDNVEFLNLQKDIEMVVSTLKEREQDVVRMRYGLGNAAKRTLEENRQHLRRYKRMYQADRTKALKKMRLSTIGQEMLAGYIG